MANASDLELKLRITADVENAIDEINKFNIAINSMGNEATHDIESISTEATNTAEAIGNIGEAAEPAAEKIQSATEEMDPALQKVTDTAEDANKQLESLIAAVATYVTLNSLGEMADQWKNIKAQIENVSKTQADYEKRINGLVNISRNSFSSLDANSKLIVQLGMSVKGTIEDQLKIAETVAKSIQLSGSGAAAASSVVRQLSQAFSSGKLRGDEFVSTMENAPRLAKALADELHVTIGELRGLAENGALTGDVLNRLLLSAASKINKEFENMPVTIERAIERLQTELTLTIGKLDETTGASSNTANAIIVLSRNIESILTVTAGGAIAAALSSGISNAILLYTKMQDQIIAVRTAQQTAIDAAMLNAQQRVVAAQNLQASIQTQLQSNQGLISLVESGLKSTNQHIYQTNKNYMTLKEGGKRAQEVQKELGFLTEHLNDLTNQLGVSQQTQTRLTNQGAAASRELAAAQAAVATNTTVVGSAMIGFRSAIASLINPMNAFTAGITFMFGMQVGETVRQWTGAFKTLDEELEKSTQLNLEKTNKKLKELNDRLGTSFNSIEDFHQAIKGGGIIWDQATKRWELGKIAIEDAMKAFSKTDAEYAQALVKTERLTEQLKAENNQRNEQKRLLLQAVELRGDEQEKIAALISVKQDNIIHLQQELNLTKEQATIISNRLLDYEKELNARKTLLDAEKKYAIAIQEVENVKQALNDTLKQQASENAEALEQLSVEMIENRHQAEANLETAKKELEAIRMSTEVHGKYSIELEKEFEQLKKVAAEKDLAVKQAENAIIKARLELEAAQKSTQGHKEHENAINLDSQATDGFIKVSSKMTGAIKERQAALKLENEAILAIADSQKNLVAYSPNLVTAMQEESRVATQVATAQDQVTNTEKALDAIRQQIPNKIIEIATAEKNRTENVGQLTNELIVLESTEAALQQRITNGVLKLTEKQNIETKLMASENALEIVQKKLADAIANHTGNVDGLKIAEQQLIEKVESSKAALVAKNLEIDKSYNATASLKSIQIEIANTIVDLSKAEVSGAGNTAELRAKLLELEQQEKSLIAIMPEHGAAQANVNAETAKYQAQLDPVQVAVQKYKNELKVAKDELANLTAQERAAVDAKAELKAVQEQITVALQQLDQAILSQSENTGELTTKLIFLEATEKNLNEVIKAGTEATAKKAAAQLKVAEAASKYSTVLNVQIAGLDKEIAQSKEGIDTKEKETSVVLKGIQHQIEMAKARGDDTAAAQLSQEAAKVEIGLIDEQIQAKQNQISITNKKIESLREQANIDDVVTAKEQELIDNSEKFAKALNTEVDSLELDRQAKVDNAKATSVAAGAAKDMQDAIKLQMEASDRNIDLVSKETQVKLKGIDAEIAAAQARGDESKVAELQADKLKIEIDLLEQQIAQKREQADATRAMAEAKQVEAKADGEYTAEEQAQVVALEDSAAAIDLEAESLVADKKAKEIAIEATKELAKQTITLESVMRSLGIEMPKDMEAANQAFSESMNSSIAHLNAMAATGSSMLTTMAWDDAVQRATEYAVSIAGIQKRTEDLEAALGKLKDEYDRGDLSLTDYIAKLEMMQSAYASLGDERLQGLRDALQGAKDDMQSLTQTVAGELKDALEELGAMTLEDARLLEDLAYQQKQMELEEQKLKAQGNADLTAMIDRVIELNEKAHQKRLDQINSEYAIQDQNKIIALNGVQSLTDAQQQQHDARMQQLGDEQQAQKAIRDGSPYKLEKETPIANGSVRSFATGGSFTAPPGSVALMTESGEKVEIDDSKGDQSAFIIPPGYPNDSFGPMLIGPGTHVKVTPADEVTPDMKQGVPTIKAADGAEFTVSKESLADTIDKIQKYDPSFNNTNISVSDLEHILKRFQIIDDIRKYDNNFKGNAYKIYEHNDTDLLEILERHQLITKIVKLKPSFNADNFYSNLQLEGELKKIQDTVAFDAALDIKLQRLKLETEIKKYDPSFEYKNQPIDDLQELLNRLQAQSEIANLTTDQNTDEQKSEIERLKIISNIVDYNPNFNDQNQLSIEKLKDYLERLKIEKEIREIKPKFSMGNYSLLDLEKKLLELQIEYKTGPGLAEGGSFIVPPGYPNDSFPLRVQSGEKVQVTPANKVTSDAGFNDKLLNGLQAMTNKITSALNPSSSRTVKLNFGSHSLFGSESAVNAFISQLEQAARVAI